MVHRRGLSLDVEIAYILSMKIGGHVSIAGGYAEALKRAVAIGANCMQMFSTSPRGWGTVAITKERVEEFRKRRGELAIDPVFFHASYLVNLADTGGIAERSVASLVAELRLAGALGVRGSIIHLGSYKNAIAEDVAKGKVSLIRNIKKILRETPDEAWFIIENSGTRKIGKDIHEIGEIIAEIGSERLHVCLDTCHLHAAGYDLSSLKKFGAFFREFDSVIGLSRLALIHANDSRDAFGSLRDRHENIGDGNIPREVFRLLLSDKRTRELPFILEVPGIKDEGPDKENVERLKSIGTRSLTRSKA